MQVLGCDANFNQLQNLQTNNFPTLDLSASGLVNGALNIVVNSPLVSNRTSSRVYLSNDLGTETCGWPQLSAWSKDFAACQEVYTFNQAWSTALNCGWDVDNSEQGYTSYTSNIFVVHDDQVDTFRGSPIVRETSHIIPIKLRFQNSVEVDTNINVFSYVNLLSAITEQRYDPDITIAEGRLAITTSLQWPFVIDSFVLPNFPANLTTALSNSTVACLDQLDQPCTQTFVIDIDPITACSLSGDYQLNFTLACRGNPADCPLDDQTDDAGVTAIVISENFCPDFSIDIGLSGQLFVYQENTYQTPKDDFLYEQTAYFQAELSATQSAVITGSQIISVRSVDEDAVTTYLYENGANTANGDLVSFALASGNPADKPGFEFSPIQGVFDVPVDGAEPFTIYAVIDVSYDGSKKKRFVLRQDPVQPGAQEAEAGSEIVVAPPAGEESDVAVASSLIEDMFGSSGDYVDDIDSGASGLATALVLILSLL